MKDTLLEIRKVEVHYWPECDCQDCRQERERREPSNPHLLSISVDAAHSLGFIPHRCPEGSLARKLALEEEGKEQVSSE